MNEEDAIKQVQRKAEQMQKTRQRAAYSPLQGFSAFGVIGWSVSVPTVLGAVVGKILARYQAAVGFHPALGALGKITAIKIIRPLGRQLAIGVGQVGLTQQAASGERLALFIEKNGGAGGKARKMLSGGGNAIRLAARQGKPLFGQISSR